MQERAGVEKQPLLNVQIWKVAQVAQSHRAQELNIAQSPAPIFQVRVRHRCHSARTLPPSNRGIQEIIKAALQLAPPRCEQLRPRLIHQNLAPCYKGQIQLGKAGRGIFGGNRPALLRGA